MKLISMTDLVIERCNEKISFMTPMEKVKRAVDAFNEIINYANFLKQPLTLGMFIPCDEKGNVLEEPMCMLKYKKQVFKRSESELEECKQYLQAKERVLFEGFKLIGSKHVENNKHIVVGVGFKNGMHKTVEDILKSCTEEYYVTLTQSAIKQLGL
jgi:hypothetical protein